MLVDRDKPTTPNDGEPDGAPQLDAPTTALIDAVRRLSLARSLDEVQRIVCTAARRLTAADGAAFVSREGDACLYADEDALEPLFRGQRFPIGSCVAGWAMQNSSAVTIPDVLADERVPGHAYRRTFVKSLAVVPVGALDPVAAIVAYWAEEHVASSPELATLQVLADSTAAAIESVGLWSSLLERMQQRTGELAVRTRELEDANAGVRELLGEATVRSEDLQAAVDYHRGILNTLAHEVRSPLTASDLMLDEILTDHVPSGEWLENLADARRCIGEAVRIVEDQLHRAKLEAGVLRPRIVEVSVADVYLALRGMVRALRRSDAVALQFEAEESPRPLHTDPHMLGQILRNLIGNALKFTELGVVAVSARFDAAGDAFVFEVADTGVGVPPADRERIFEDFGQVAAAERARRSGTGLGLPLSRTLAVTLGGSLELAEREGPGCTFVLRLPARPPPSPGGRGADAAAT